MVPPVGDEAEVVPLVGDEVVAAIDVVEVEPPLFDDLDEMLKLTL